MNTYDATEQAYRNGYKAGVMELAERLKKEACYFGRAVLVEDIDTIAKELTERKEDGKNG